MFFYSYAKKFDEYFSLLLLIAKILYLHQKQFIVSNKNITFAIKIILSCLPT